MQPPTRRNIETGLVDEARLAAGTELAGRIIQRHAKWRRRWRAGLALVASALLAGCAVGPDFHPPAPPAVNSFTSRPPGKTASTSGHGGKAQRFTLSANIAADWWQVFHSPQLDALIEQALARNPTLKAARARLDQARANLAAANGGLYPHLDAQLGAGRQKVSGARFGDGPGSAGIFNLYGASLNATWNLDIFGGARRGIEARAARVDFQHNRLRAAYLSLVGNVVSTAINAAAFQARLDATQTILKAEERAFELVKAQEQVGAVSRADVLQARAQLAATRTKLAPLRQQLTQAQHLLATLTGTFPGNWQPVKFDIDELTLPGTLPLVVPSSLVRRRPDIRAAQAALHAASANIGIAAAKLYPSINLTGSYGSEATDVGDLFDPVTTIWNIGASLLAPLFHGGALRAQKRAAVAAYKESLANYQQTVLTAFGQVADVLRALENDADGLSAQRSALKAARKSLNLAQVQYKAGAAGFLTVLTSVRQLQQAQLGYVQALARRYQDTARLFNALGGGWWNRTKLAATQLQPDVISLAERSRL